MRRFLLRLVYFFIPVLAYMLFCMLVLPRLGEIYNGPTTAHQIKLSFEHATQKRFDTYVFGNSRMYRGFNPEKMQWPTFNFSHDNDSYNQIYYKIKYLKKNQIIPRHIILGVDYFQFSVFVDTRNYAYGSWLDKEYLLDYQKPWLRYMLQYYVDCLNPQKWLLLKPRPAQSVAYLKENGQYVKDVTGIKPEIIKRTIKREAVQERYFEQILAFCKHERIALYLVMLPTQKQELDFYTEGERADFDNFIQQKTKQYGAVYLNFTNTPGFTSTYYADLTHFNQQGADKFTTLLNDTVLQISR